MAFRIAPENVDSELQRVWRREMFAETYIPSCVCVKTENGDVYAISFVINTKHEHYVQDLDLEKIAERVVLAEGKCGSCHDYVLNTVKCLHQLELRDPVLEQLLTLIKDPHITV